MAMQLGLNVVLAVVVTWFVWSRVQGWLVRQAQEGPSCGAPIA